MARKIQNNEQLQCSTEIRNRRGGACNRTDKSNMAAGLAILYSNYLLAICTLPISAAAFHVLIFFVTSLDTRRRVQQDEIKPHFSQWKLTAGKNKGCEWKTEEALNHMRSVSGLDCAECLDLSHHVPYIICVKNSKLSLVTETTAMCCAHKHT